MKNPHSLLKFSCFVVICLKIGIINSSTVTTEYMIEDISTISEQNTENLQNAEENYYDLKNVNTRDINISTEINNKESISNTKESMTSILKHKIALIPAKCLLEYHSDTEGINLTPIDYNSQKIQLQDLNEKSKSHSIYNSESSFTSITQSPLKQIVLPSTTTLTFITKKPDEISQKTLEKNVDNLDTMINISNEDTDNLILKQQLSMQTTKLPTVSNIPYSYRRFGIQDDVKNIETSTSKTPDITIQSEQLYDPDEQSEPLYEQKMKFIIPYPLKISTSLSKYPWEMDQYAYYPAHLRPAYMNIPVPYIPTYHLIKTLTIPNDTV